MRKLENLYRQNLRRMRKTLETKLEKASTALEEQKLERKKRFSDNQETMRVKREQAAAMKKDLEEGLEKWRQQVLEVQENNINRAKGKVEEKNKLRRQRSK